MTQLAGNGGLSFEGFPCPLKPPSHVPALRFFLLVCHRLTLVPSGVDGDDFTATTSDQQDALQPFGQNLEELHVW